MYKLTIIWVIKTYHPCTLKDFIKDSFIFCVINDMFRPVHGIHNVKYAVIPNVVHECYP
jgi:hypothetical protein